MLGIAFIRGQRLIAERRYKEAEALLRKHSDSHIAFRLLLAESLFFADELVEALPIYKEIEESSAEAGLSKENSIFVRAFASYRFLTLTAALKGEVHTNKSETAKRINGLKADRFLKSAFKLAV